MDYEKTITLPSAAATTKAMDLATRVFTDNGFRIIEKTNSRLEVEGPGMCRTRMAEIRGVSHATVSLTGNSVSLSATFGALRRMRKIIAIMLIAMALIFLVTFLIIAPYMHWSGGPPEHPRRSIGIISTVPFAPWVVILPAIIAGKKKRLRRELDTLMHNMTVMQNG